MDNECYLGSMSFPRYRRQLLITLGTISTTLGIVGIFVPILPTTPLLLLAAACFIRSSERFYHWLLNNRFFGTYIRNYIEHRGMSLKIKIFTITSLWVTISFSVFINHNQVLRIILFLVAIGVTIHIILIKTRR